MEKRVCRIKLLREDVSAPARVAQIACIDARKNVILLLGTKMSEYKKGASYWI